MISITDYPVHDSQAARFGNDADLFSVLNIDYGKTVSTADRVFRYLNRPLPEGAKPSDLVDCAKVLPKPLTVEQLAKKAGKSVSEIEERIEKRFLFEDYTGGGTDSKGRTKYYWSQVQQYLSCELLTVNKAAEMYDVDRRTLKKYLQRKLDQKHIYEPLTDQQGGREYSLYWPDDLEFVCKNDIKSGLGS